MQSSDCALKGRRRVVELIEVRRHKSVGVLALGCGCNSWGRKESDTTERLNCELRTVVAKTNPQLRNVPPPSSRVGS